MKVESYVGINGDCIIIQRPTDIYSLLDWCQSIMIANQENEKMELNKDKWQKAIDYLDTLMTQVEKDGFVNFDDIDNIEY